MRQYDAVEKIAKTFIADGLVDAIYLKGSIARGSEDSYSNIDMYCLLKEVNILPFKDNAYTLLENYAPILYYKAIKNKIFCVFDDDIVLNLHFHTLDKLTYEDKIVVIYDPNEILKEYIHVPVSLTANKIGKLVDELLINALDFRKAYLRNDELFSYDLAGTIIKYLGIIYRAKYDLENAWMGLKGFDINYPEKQKFYEAIKMHKISSSLECVKMIFVLLDSYINNLPILLVEHINLDFYAYTKRKIMSID